MRTIGIHPKVALPVALLALAGAIVLTVALATGNDHALAVALTILGASGITGAAGYIAPPGAVQNEPITPSDDHLSNEAHATIGNTQP